MKTIYLVSVGAYSDYAIHSVWSTKEQAEKMVEILNCETTRISSYSARIEEFKLDIPQCETIGRSVEIDLTSGKITQAPEPCLLETGIPKTYLVNFYEKQTVEKLNGKWQCSHYDGYLPIKVRAEHHTEDLALKSALDLRATKLAELEGIS